MKRDPSRMHGDLDYAGKLLVIMTLRAPMVTPENSA